MPQLDDSVVPVLVAAAAVVLAVVMLGVIRVRSRRQTVGLAPAFEPGTAHPAGLLGTSVEGLFRGYSCRYTIEQPSEYSPGGGTLRVSAASPLAWSAGISDLGSRLLVRAGILRDMEIGDAVLDQRLRFGSADEGSLVAMFGQQAVRAAMGLLAESVNFKSITVSHDRVEVKWSPRRRELDDSEQVLRERIGLVVGLLEACGTPPRIG